MQQFFMQDGQFKRGVIYINIYVIYRCIKKKCLHEKIKLLEEIYMFLFLFSIFFLNTINFCTCKNYKQFNFLHQERSHDIFFSYQIFIIFNRPKRIYQHFIHSYLYSAITNLFKWYNFVLNNFFHVTINEIDMFKMYPHLNRLILHPHYTHLHSTDHTFLFYVTRSRFR